MDVNSIYQVLIHLNPIILIIVWSAVKKNYRKVEDKWVAKQ